MPTLSSLLLAFIAEHMSCMEYPLDQFESALLAVSPHTLGVSFPPSAYWRGRECCRDSTSAVGAVLSQHEGVLSVSLQF